MRIENTPGLKKLFIEAGRLDYLAYSHFEADYMAWSQMLPVIWRQHPNDTIQQKSDRCAFRVILSQARKGQPKRKIKKRLGLRFWIIVAAIIAAGILAGFVKLHAEPTPQNLQAYKNAIRGFVLAQVRAGQPEGLTLVLQNGASTVATRRNGLVILKCSTNLSCSFSGNTFTLTGSAGGGTGCVPPGVSGNILTDDGLGGCTTEISKVPVTLGGTNLTSLSAHLLYVGNGAAAPVSVPIGTAGQVLESNGAGSDPSFQDPFVSGPVAHDGAGAAVNPLPGGCFANAAAPADVSADVDIVREWCLRNGARVFNLADGGTLITRGQKTMANSLPVVIASDQSAVPVSGTVTTTPPANASTNVAQFGGTNVSTGTGAGGAGIPRVTISNDSSLAANQSVNTAQFGGTNVSTGTGAGGAGIPRVTISNDSSLAANQSVNTAQFGGTNVSTGTGAGGAGIPRVTISNDSSLAANQSVNVAQINGVAPLMGNGATGTGSQRETVSNDNTAIANWGQGATGSAVPTGGQQIGGNGSGNLTAPLIADGYAFYDAATNGATQLVALVSGKVIYVLGYSFSSSSATANTLKFVYGTGSNCATGQTAMTPGIILQAPASTGPIGKEVPVSGFQRGLKTAASNALCILTNAAQAAQVEVWYTQF